MSWSLAELGTRTVKLLLLQGESMGSKLLGYEPRIELRAPRSVKVSKASSVLQSGLNAALYMR